MRDFIAKISLTALFVLAIFSASAAEKVTFEANSPLTVAVGEPFRVEFALNAQPEPGSFKAPSFEGFDVIAGPAEAQGQSIQIVNNSMTRVVNYTITYVLVPQGAGNVTVGAAEVTVEGTTYRTKPLAIEVVDEGKAPGGGGSAAGGQPQRREEASSESAAQSRVAKDDILLRAIVSRTSVFKGEPLRVTFKLYERVPIVGYNDVKFPSFNGFWAQELNTENARRERETFNGKVYETLVAKEYLLYPQQAGTLVIEPAEITAVAQVVIQSRRSLDPFFGGGHDFVNVPRKVQSPRINVTVKPLPAGAPASFSGAVGSFAMDAVLPPDRLAANSAATYTVKISGTGNLTFVQAPKLTLPASFEQYNVKTTESINASAAGISGYRQFEYPFIARAEGTYEVEPVEFSYFDPARMQYMTLRSRPLELEITPDAKGGGGDAYVVQGRGMSKEEVKMLGQDIRFIKLGNAQLRPVRGSRSFSVRSTGCCSSESWPSSRRSTWRCASRSASRRTPRWCAESVPTRSPCSVSGSLNAIWRSKTAMPSTRRCSGLCGGTWVTSSTSRWPTSPRRTSARNCTSAACRSRNRSASRPSSPSATRRSIRLLHRHR